MYLNFVFIILISKSANYGAPHYNILKVFNYSDKSFFKPAEIAIANYSLTILFSINEKLVRTY